ncbi:MAG: BamA/TamA family outer membrane protein [Filimonas sp.]|nr:BamA/TamA family outer membrane protein [Filimonas sp.]
MIFYRKPLFLILVSLFAVVCFLSSCSEQRRTTVKNYPVDTPYVFSNLVKLEGKLSKDERNKLQTQLENYWDDSLVARKSQQFFFFYKLRNPPVFDSANINPTITFMRGYLNSQGYYNPSFKDTFYVDTFNNQRRVSVEINIAPGKNLVVDSIGYALADTTLEQLALTNTKDAYLKKGVPYSKQLVATELDRLVSLYRRNGYFYLTRENLIAEIDTTDKALLELTIDPFEQAQKIAAAAERRKQNPVADILVMQRQAADSATRRDSLMLVDTSAFKRYYVGNTFYYPETRATEIPDSLMNDTSLLVNKRRTVTMLYRDGKFKIRPMFEHTYLRKDSVYNEDLFFKTMNNLGSIGAWGQVDSRMERRGDTIDFHYFLVPNIKQNVTVSLEASRNTGDVVTTGSFFGTALNFSYRNRNVWQRAIQSFTALRGGVELSFSEGSSLLQTLQGSVAQTYSFPRFITPFKIGRGERNRQRLDNVKTLLSVTGSYTDRKDFFRIRSLVTGWGYEWKIKYRNGITGVWQYKPLNIELYSLDTLPKLDTAFKLNPYLRTAFNTGKVVSQQLSFSTTFSNFNHPNITHFIRVSAEESGFLAGLTNILRDDIYRFIKLEGEYRQLINFKKTSLAFRGYAGAGYNYGNNEKFGKTLPFFKQFIAGGPNSMRAWGLRLLGQGSSLLSDTSGAFRDRYGDMQLEANAEYRYKIAQIGSMNVAGALFVDAGNIWNIRKDSLNPNSEFSISRFGHDIAIGVGTGIRLDFNYFLIRVDFGIKLKDPARLANNGWMDLSDFTWRNKEFTVYDATDPSHQRIINRNNYAIQLGIGLPF